MKKTKRAVPAQAQQLRTAERKSRLIREIAEAQLTNVKGGGDLGVDARPCSCDIAR